jgi:hypothetical protein
MELRFDPHDRRLRIRTMAPPGQQARTFVAGELFQFGIEEEYFLSDARTLQAASRTPDALFHGTQMNRLHINRRASTGK